MSPRTPYIPNADEISTEDLVRLTLTDLCRSCRAEREAVLALINEGAIEPQGGKTPEEWSFSTTHLRQTRIAVNLQRDLGINPAGAALALQLMNEIDRLCERLHALGDDETPP